MSVMRRISSGLLGIALAASSGCKTNVDYVEQEAVLLPDKPMSLDHALSIVLLEKKTQDIMLEQYERSKQTGREWGGVILQTKDGDVVYRAITNTFDHDIMAFQKWLNLYDHAAKHTLDAHIQIAEGHLRRECRVPQFVPMHDYDALKNEMHTLHTKVQPHLCWMMYHDRVSKWLYSPDPHELERHVKECNGTVLGILHAHHEWIPGNRQGSVTDHLNSIGEAMIIAVPRDGRMYFVHVKDGNETLVGSCKTSDPHVLSYPEEK